MPPQPDSRQPHVVHAGRAGCRSRRVAGIGLPRARRAGAPAPGVRTPDSPEPQEREGVPQSGHREARSERSALGTRAAARVRDEAPCRTRPALHRSARRRSRAPAFARALHGSRLRCSARSRTHRGRSSSRRQARRGSSRGHRVSASAPSSPEPRYATRTRLFGGRSSHSSRRLTVCDATSSDATR